MTQHTEPAQCSYSYRHRDGHCTNTPLDSSPLCEWHIEVAGKDFRRRNLRNADLHEAYLVQARLHFADLENANLAYANLRDAILWQANLRGALLAHADMTGADLFHAAICDARDLQSALLDQVEVNESRGDELLAGTGLEYETYRGAIDAYGRAKAVHTSLKTYFRHAGLYRRSGNHYVRETLIERKRLRIAPKVTREEDFRWHFPTWTFPRGWLCRSVFRLRCISARLWNRTLYHTSRYGESPGRVLLSYFAVAGAYAVLYWLSGGVAHHARDAVATNQWAGFSECLYFSMVTFTTLGFGDYQPRLGTARILAASEALVGAVLLAYLVVVISRRIMR